MTKKIKNVGAKRKQLSEIFQIRGAAVSALNFDNDADYRSAIEDLKDAVVKLEAT